MNVFLQLCVFTNAQMCCAGTPLFMCVHRHACKVVAFTVLCLQQGV